MQVGGDLAVLDGQHHLDQTRHPSCGLEMADVRLHRADGQPIFRGPPLAHHPAEGQSLDGVTKGGTRAMGLHVLHLMRGHSCPLQGRADHLLLGRTTGGGQPITAAIVIDGGAPHNGKNVVACGKRLGQPLQHHHPAAFGPTIAIGARVKGLATPIGGQGSHLGKSDERLGREHEIYGPDQRQITLFFSQALTGQVRSRQGGGAGRFYLQDRALQAQQIGQPTSSHGPHGAQAVVGVDTLPVARVDEVPKVVEAAANERAGARAPQLFRCLPGPFQSLPAHLQQQPLLWIHPSGFAG